MQEIKLSLLKTKKQRKRELDRKAGVAKSQSGAGEGDEMRFDGCLSRILRKLQPNGVLSKECNYWSVWSSKT